MDTGGDSSWDVVYSGDSHTFSGECAENGG